VLFACLFAPFFIVEAVMRTEEGTVRLKSNAPVAVLDGPESWMRVIACNPPAAGAGVIAGMSKAEADQISCLILQKRSPEGEQRAQSALIECAQQFSPRVESTAAGAITLDLAGLEKLFGPPKKIATAIRKHALSMGFEVNVAVAANPDTVLLIAKGIAGITVVAQGKEARVLAALPLDVLSPAAEQLDVLNSWGIHTCGALARLPSVELTERLGKEGLRLQRLAQGQTMRTLIPFERPYRFEESMQLEDAVETLEPLMFVINNLLQNVLSALRAAFLVVQELHLTLELQVCRDSNIQHRPKHTQSVSVQRVLKLPVPMQDTKTLLKLLQLDLESHRLAAPVIAVTLKAIPAKPRAAQGNLFIRSAPEAEKVEVLQAKLRSVVGPQDAQGRNTVGAPCVVDSHKPDSFAVEPFAEPSGKKKPRGTSQPEENLLRIYRPPKEARVQTRNGRPAHLFFAGLSSTVSRASGPWRHSGGWWNGNWEHDVWDVELPFSFGFGRYRIYRDLQKHGWYVRGKFN